MSSFVCCLSFIGTSEKQPDLGWFTLSASLTAGSFINVVVHEELTKLMKDSKVLKEAGAFSDIAVTKLPMSRHRQVVGVILTRLILCWITTLRNAWSAGARSQLNFEL